MFKSKLLFWIGALLLYGHAHARNEQSAWQPAGKDKLPGPSLDLARHKSVRAQTRHLSDYVNPMIGASTSTERAGVAHGMGKTFPGAATPFDMVQLSPNTIIGGDNGPGYTDEHRSIEGFAFTHMSGIGWYGDLGNFLVMPFNGRLYTNSGREKEKIKGYRSQFSKESEVAKAGYYAVNLSEINVKAEMTAAPGSGILRFTFPRSDSAGILIDLAHRIGGTSVEQYVKVLNSNTIQGWMKCTPAGGGWGNGDGKPNYTVFFYAQFSKPFNKTGLWSADIPEGQNRLRQFEESTAFQELTAKAERILDCKEMQGKHLGFFTQFSTGQNEQVLLKVGISFVSMEGARLNLEQEIKDFDFNAVYRKARASWDKELGKMKVEGGTEEQKHCFYTALYHSMIDPRKFSDVDGKYPGGDGEIHQSRSFTKRTVFSGWDVFRSQFPLQTIINPAIVNDMINSLVELADENGTHYLERWEFLNAYSGCMIGNPAVSVIADAYSKNIRDFNLEKAYRFSKNSCEKFGNGTLGHSYTISHTLEHAYFEWCLAQFAGKLGKVDDSLLYMKRAQSYRNIFDPEVAWFRPRKKNGQFEPWPKEGRLAQDYGCVESNPYQQGWFVPHDIPGLCGLLGGKEKTIADLQHFFENSSANMLWNNYYNHPNEPVHLTPFLFNRLRAPWLTQYWVRQICENAYSNKVEGLVGNEDEGQMSAWYVLAAIGLHPACPGEPSYEIFSPLFNKIKIKTIGGVFTIKALHNSAQNRFIQSATLNGKPLQICQLQHADLLKGGQLVLQMGSLPNKEWGIN